jgi:alcohol dehydrogenase
MKAWRLAGFGGELKLKDVPVPEPRPGSVLVRIQAASLLSYMKSYVEGKLPAYNPPPVEFTIGTNGVGIVAAVGRDVWHLKPGQQVVVSPHLIARENVAEPGQILIALTSFGSAPMLADWPDGTLAEYALMPVECVTSAEGLDEWEATQLAVGSRFIVPFGGLLRGRLAAGESVIVTGATGAYGSAAVLLALAMGARRVVAAGRRRAALDGLAAAGGARVTTVEVTGDAKADAEALRAASGGGAELAFDMVGQAKDPNATLAALHSLRRGGRLVLMGSMTTDLSLPYMTVMLNNLEVLGQFMFPAGAYHRLLELVRCGLLDFRHIRPRVYALEQLPEAMEAAASAGNLECVVMRP